MSERVVGFDQRCEQDVALSVSNVAGGIDVPNLGRRGSKRHWSAVLAAGAVWWHLRCLSEYRLYVHGPEQCMRLQHLFRLCQPLGG